MKPAPAAPRPVRVQLQRTKGWRMPPNTVRVTRGTGKAGRFGNPFRPHDGSEAAAIAVVKAYRKWLTAPAGAVMDMFPGPFTGLEMIAARNRVRDELPSLRGKNLACWCPPGAPCHAEVLLELANAPPKPGRPRNG